MYLAAKEVSFLLQCSVFLRLDELNAMAREFGSAGLFSFSSYVWSSLINHESVCNQTDKIRPNINNLIGFVAVI